MSSDQGIRPTTIAYLGPPGTFSEEALRAALGSAASEARLVPYDTNHDVVLAVENNEVDAALAPIENSVEGAVTQTLDALVHDATSTHIVGELVWPIHLCVIAGEAVGLSEVTTIASHPQPLAQSANYIRDYLPNATRLFEASTAEAVRKAVANKGGYAAIGSKISAETYGGTVLATAVEDVAGNKTRFVWLAKDELESGWLGTAPHEKCKTSVVFTGFNDTSPGALVSILSEFAYRSVNMSKIESRPERTELGHYLFFVDLDGAIEEAPVAEAIKAIESKVREIRVLGSFPAHEA